MVKLRKLSNRASSNGLDRKTSFTKEINGSRKNRLLNNGHTIVWSKAAQIASSSLNDAYAVAVETRLNSYKNGSSKEFNKIYALKLSSKYRAIFQRTTEGYKVLDIVNHLNYDPNKVVEIS